MNIDRQSDLRMVTLEAKFLAVYFSALVAASLAEIESCRSDLGCDPVIGPAIILEGATPMLVVLLFAPMTRRWLAGVIVAIFGGILWLRLYSVYSGDAIDSLGNILALWTFGTFLAVTALVLFNIYYFHKINKNSLASIVMPVGSKADISGQNCVGSVLSRKRTMVLLCAAVGVGTLVGQIEIYRTLDIWSLDLSTLVFYSYFAGCAVAPLVVILWNSELKKNGAVILSIVVGILILICNVLFAHEVFGNAEWEAPRARLGFVYLWFGTLLVSSLIVVYRKLSTRADLK